MRRRPRSAGEAPCSVLRLRESRRSSMRRYAARRRLIGDMLSETSTGRRPCASAPSMAPIVSPQLMLAGVLPPPPPVGRHDDVGILADRFRLGIAERRSAPDSSRDGAVERLGDDGRRWTIRRGAEKALARRRVIAGASVRRSSWTSRLQRRRSWGGLVQHTGKCPRQNPGFAAGVTEW